MTPTMQRTKGSKVKPTEAESDHIYSTAKGGDGATVTDQRNIETICATCNAEKGDKIE